MRIAVIIPAHNASQAITLVLKKAKGLGFFCVVIDDGSTDNTYEAAQIAGAVVLRHQKNLGKGAALRTGFDYAVKNDYDAVITMDADGQHDPASLTDFAESALARGSLFIVGNRMNETARMPWIRVMTNRFMSWILSKKMGQYVPDTQCGYRFIAKELLLKMRLNASYYEIESEMLIKAAKAGVKIDSMPISSIYAGHKSRINPVIDTLRFIKLMLTL